MHTVCRLTQIRARASTLLLVTTGASLLLALLIEFSQVLDLVSLLLCFYFEGWSSFPLETQLHCRCRPKLSVPVNMVSSYCGVFIFSCDCVSPIVAACEGSVFLSWY